MERSKTMKEEELYMLRCIQLAKNGACRVSPNPMVGAVIVHNNQIIGEGYHIHYGATHAEVNAIASVQNESVLPHSTMYVSLEPCSHYGKTPPCVDLIISKKIPQVVIGCIDPFDKVAGRGVRKLQDAGIKVRVGVLEKDCQALIRRFITFHQLQRPYILLKWAESADGFLDIERTDGSPTLLSNELTGMLVHKKRAESDAILVGTNTARLDNPSLTVRNWCGNHPTRIVLDRELTLSRQLHLFDGTVRTLVFTSQSALSIPNVEYIQLNFNAPILPQLLHELYLRNIQSLMVEGGSKLLQSFIDANLYDELFIEKTQHILQKGIKSPTVCMDRFKSEQVFGNQMLHTDI